MKTATSIAMSVLFIAPLGLASLGGCAGDKNKQLDEAAAQQAEAARSQREAQIEQSKKQQMETIEANKRTVQNMPEGSQPLAKAQSEMVEDRQKFQADAQARVQKVQARLDEARTKLQIARGRAPLATSNRLEETSRLAAMAARDVDHLSQVSNDAWESEKKRVDKELSDLENASDDVKSKADSVMP